MGSIIDPKYKGRAARADFVSKLITDHASTPVLKVVKTKDEDGTVTETTEPTGKTSIDLEKLFAIAEANGFNATLKYGDQVERLNAPGRLRMTIGNVLRAVARKRGGLNVDGKFVHADDEFMAGALPTHNPDGTKIAKAPVTSDKEPVPA